MIDFSDVIDGDIVHFFGLNTLAKIAKQYQSEFAITEVINSGSFFIRHRCSPSTAAGPVLESTGQAQLLA
jgi:hypothetical protein